MNPSLFSSYSQDWETPQDLFDHLNKRYKFTLDPCATRHSAKCEKFFTIEDDGLAQSWAGERVFLNPPYGRLMPKWMKKAFDSTMENSGVVCLIPARTDTRWWHAYAQHGVIEFLKGRLEFTLRITDSMRDAVFLRRDMELKAIAKETGLPQLAVVGCLEGESTVSDVAPFPSAVVTLAPRCEHCQQTLVGPRIQ